MTRLEQALFAKWISRFGAQKVRELANGLDAGRTTAERARALVQSSGREELRALLLEGFDGFFHQTVYIRKLADPQQAIKLLRGIPLREKGGSVVLEEMAEASKSEVRCLLMVTERMEFLQNAGTVFAEEIPFPIAVDVDAAHRTFTVRILTMQITVETWGGIVEKQLRRMLTVVHADSLCEEALNFLHNHNIDIGEYVDFSGPAAVLMKRDAIDTLSGTYEVGTRGSTKHNTLRGKNRRSLRDSMPKKFNELVSAKRITHAEVEWAGDCLGLKQRAKVALYPTTGKMAFRSRLQGNDPDEFIKEMAG